MSFRTPGPIALQESSTESIPVDTRGGIPGSDTPIPIRDISDDMRLRATRGYNLNIETNMALLKDSPVLLQLWRWVKSCQKDGSHGQLGVRHILLQDAKNPAKSQPFFPPRDTLLSLPIYDELRIRALHHCGWSPLGDTEACEAILGALEASGEYERAAAVAVFYLKVPRAIQGLTRAASVAGTPDEKGRFLTAAMSLAGFCSGVGANELLLETCAAFRTDLPSPFLRAVFAFLTCTDGTFSGVLRLFPGYLDFFRGT